MSPRVPMPTVPTAEEYAEQRRLIAEHARDLIAAWRGGEYRPLYEGRFDGPELTALGELHALRVVYHPDYPEFCPVPQFRGGRFIIEVLISVGPKTWPVICWADTAERCVKDLLMMVEQRLQRTCPTCCEPQSGAIVDTFPPIYGCVNKHSWSPYKHPEDEK